MVRFSDMLGGSGEPEEARAESSPFAALTSEALDSEADAEADARPDVDEEAEPATGADPQPMPASNYESPEAVLDRLTQYATSRSADRVTPPEETKASGPDPGPDAAEPDALSPEGDDILPHPKPVERRPGRGHRRHP
jgi:hypothetical protein